MAEPTLKKCMLSVARIFMLYKEWDYLEMGKKKTLLINSMNPIINDDTESLRNCGFQDVDVDSIKEDLVETKRLISFDNWDSAEFRMDQAMNKIFTAIHKVEI